MSTILVVDQSSEARRVAGGCLRDHGMSPIFAANGEEALALLERDRPAAVLTGLNMHVMDGLELVERMRKEHSGVPVVLITANGTERVAAHTLKAGALSYVPRRDLHADLCNVMGVVFEAVEASRRRERVRELVEHVDSHFVLGTDHESQSALIAHLQTNLSEYEFCDETGLFQISLCLTEALHNAVDHGSLELDSRLREESFDDYDKLRGVRAQNAPYCDRRVYVAEHLTQREVRYIVRDEGPGFNVASIPDPTDPENLLNVSGRGLMLISTFMDSVRFNGTGNEITMLKRAG